MQSAPSERSAEQVPEEPGTGWQWDGEGGDGAAGSGDVVSGGGEPDGPRLSRRRLLAGAGALAAGGALWAFTRSAGGGSTPAPPRPAPTRLAGPEPLWTYRGPEAMTPERLTDRPGRPVFLSRGGLQVLDPATGARLRTLAFPAPGKDWPSDLELPAARVVVGADRVFTSSRGHLDSRHLSDSAADWSLPLPEPLDGTVDLFGCDGTTLYGRSWAAPTNSDRINATLFALRIEDRSLRWSRPAEDVDVPLATSTDLLPARASENGTTRLVLLDAADGHRLWTVSADENLRWAAADREHVYAPDGQFGLRALRPADGTPRWSVLPGPSEEWRCLPPVSDGARVYVPRDNGLITAHDAATGARLWSHRVPFRLDRRSRPLLAGPALYVPGPAAAGICALDAGSGTELWTFRDSGPGVDVWTLSADSAHLYAGHDDTLHALPLA